MIYEIFGTINKRIDVGRNRRTGALFIKGGSNCIEFTSAELECLIHVLDIIRLWPEVTHELLIRKHIDLWEPAPPPAEEKL